MKEPLKKIERGDTILCTNSKFNRNNRRVKKILYLCSIKNIEVATSESSDKYYCSRVLLTEKKYSKQGKYVFAVKVLNVIKYKFIN